MEKGEHRFDRGGGQGGKEGWGGLWEWGGEVLKKVTLGQLLSS